jgi:hypothetical protein
MKTIATLLLSMVSAADRYLYENYSFDYPAHKLPISYTPLECAIELHHHVKLNNKVPNKGGAYLLDKPLPWKDFEIDVSFNMKHSHDDFSGL